MKWQKLGRIYCPNKDDKYQYAMFPVVSVEDETMGKIRIYYTQRDRDNYGFPTYMDCLVRNDSIEILKNDHSVLLEKSLPGTFDDSGVNITCMLKDGNKRLFYYLAWNLGVTVPFRNSVGVAEAIDDSNLEMKRVFDGPVLDRTKEYPYLATTPYVLNVHGVYKMWFACGEPWIIREDGSFEVACHIEYAESDDGFTWKREGIISVGHENGDHITTTPFLLYENGIYKMWYSYRGEKYRIGYAESKDGKIFVRKDNEVGITVSNDGWDSEMVCYPYVFDVGGNRYMIYCGNAYGKEGMGLAKLVSEE